MAWGKAFEKNYEFFVPYNQHTVVHGGNICARPLLNNEVRSVSATIRSREATQKSNEIPPISGQATMAGNGADQAKETAHTVSETVAEAVDTATAISSKVVEHTREAMMMGVRTAADVGGRVADISPGRGHPLLASAAHTMDIYRDTSERSADRVQVLFLSWMAMGRGLQQRPLCPSPSWPGSSGP